MKKQIVTGTLLNECYRIIRVLGEGGMGSVYLAEDIRLPGKEWAVKEMNLKRKNALDDQRALRQFQEEARILKTLHHPSLPEVVDFFQEGSQWFIVMERIHGKTLRQAIEERKAPLSQEEAFSTALQLLDALDYLHRQPRPVIYRDLKPSNIMITPENRIVLIDFGIARFFDPDKETDTLKMGSAGYAPPEQYKGQGTTDPRSDLYSLGATLHYAVTGRDPEMEAPFCFPPIRTLNPDLSPVFEKVLMRALEMDKEYRYPTAQDMAKELKKLKGFFCSVTPVPLFSGFSFMRRYLPATRKDKLMLLRILILILLVALAGAAHRLVGDYISMKEKREAEVHFAGATSFMMQGKYREALEQYSKALDLKKDDPVILYQMGIAYRRVGEYGQAKKSLIKALTHNPAIVDARRELSVVELIDGNFDNAYIQLQKADDEPSADPAVPLIQSLALKGMGKKEESESAYRRFCALVPDERERQNFKAAIIPELGEKKQAQ
ncbi:MAG: protein kinase [Candidatus Xenobiia bacterium LiM19]